MDITPDGYGRFGGPLFRIKAVRFTSTCLSFIGKSHMGNAHIVRICFCNLYASAHTHYVRFESILVERKHAQVGVLGVLNLSVNTKPLDLNLFVLVVCH